MPSIIKIKYEKDKTPAKPLYAAIYDITTKQLEYIPLYLKGLKTTIYEVKQNLNKIYKLLITEDKKYINNLVNLCYYLDDPLKIRNTRETGYKDWEGSLEVEKLKQELKIQLKHAPKPEQWMIVKGKVAPRYAHLAKIGVRAGPYIHKYYCDYNTFSGRSRNCIFNAQGASENIKLQHVDQSNNIFISFDWVAADINTVAYFSKDEKLIELINSGDPYQKLTDDLNNDEFITDREEVKNNLLTSIYALNSESAIVQYFPKMAKWLNEQNQKFHEGEILTTALGMSLVGREIRSAINGMTQGTVAESIQNTIANLTINTLNKLLTESHDSLVFCCKKKEIIDIIDEVSSLMVTPLNEFDVPIHFPIKICIGKGWCEWKTYKTIR